MPAPTVLFLALGVVTSLVLPIALLIVYCRRHRVSALPALVGAVAFYLTVMVLEMRFNIWLLGMERVREFLISNAFVFTLWGSLTAGLFEETARLLCLWLLARRYRGVRTGITYGIGHGGIEAILFVGLLDGAALLAVIWTAVGAGIPGWLFTAEALEQIAAAPSNLYLAGAIERLFAMTVHIANSVLVWLAVNRRGKAWLYPVAIGTHTLVGFGAGLYQYGALRSIWAVEAYTAVVAAAIAVLAWRMLLFCNRDHSDLLRYDPL